MSILQTITELSHEFGTSDYVRGGGGNTSCKDEHTLWVKPSGTTLSGLTPETFIALNREKLAELYSVKPPAVSSVREALVKEMIEQAVLLGTPGRASVEAPLHDSLKARYVVHTHPCIVNGMTCSKNGKKVCEKLFPSALWLDYIDPGYTLCMKVCDKIDSYKQKHGKEPSIIFLGNHGVFIAADTPQEIDDLYGSAMSVLAKQYESACISTELKIRALPDKAKQESADDFIKENYLQAEISIKMSGSFNVSQGPISPDHVVYAKSYIFTGKPDEQALADFQQKYGYLPNVIAWDNMVFGIGTTETKASLALEFARDGALVMQLAKAFGGIEYLSDLSRDFIENWEVESYRSKQL